MKYLSILLISLISVKPSLPLNCLTCTSEDGNNTPCEDLPEDNNITSILCPEDRDSCFASVTRIVESNKRYYRRGCCKLKDDDVDCPSNKEGHQRNSLFELWRYSCNSDGCNIDDATTRVDGTAGNVIIVKGKSGAPQIFNSLPWMLLMSILFIIS